MDQGCCAFYISIIFPRFRSLGDKWYDWFVDNEMVKNKTGDWYFGVVVLKNPNHPSATSGSCAGLSKADLSDSFGFKRYDLRIFTGGQFLVEDTNQER